MKSVDFIDEQHIIRLETHQDTCKIAWLVKHRAGSGLEAHTQFVGYDVGKSGFAQAGRAMQQRVVERLATHPCSLHEDTEIVHNLVLAGKKSSKRSGRNARSMSFSTPSGRPPRPRMSISSAINTCLSTANIAIFIENRCFHASKLRIPVCA